MTEVEQSREAVVATVDGSEVTTDQVRARLIGPQNGEMSPAAVRSVLDELIRIELLYARAKARGYEDHPRVKALMAGLFQADAVSPGRASIVGEIEPLTDDEIRRYYEDHRAQFALPEKVRARRILIAFGVDRAASRAKAEEIRARVAAAPESFGKLALENSNGPERQRQGEIGFFPASGRPDLDPRLVETAFALEDGAISPVIETAEGWSVVQVVSRTSPADLSSERVKQSIARRIERDRREKAFEEYVAELRSKANVMIDEKALEDITASFPAREPHGAQGESQG